MNALLAFFFCLTVFIGYNDCTPLPAVMSEKVVPFNTIPQSNISPTGLDELQQLHTSIEQMRLQAKDFESSLHTIKPFQLIRLTNAQLQHGSQNDLIALQHALLVHAHSICSSPPSSDIRLACLRYDGFPDYTSAQAYKSVTLLYLLRSLPLAELDEFVKGFLETATYSDIATLKRVLKYSKNTRIHHIFGDDLKGNSGIIGRHMKRNENAMHIHLHGIFPSEPVQSLQNRFVKRKFVTPLPQCTFKKRSIQEGVTMKKRKFIRSPPECNGNMTKRKDHYEQSHTMNKPMNLDVPVRKS